MKAALYATTSLILFIGSIYGVLTDERTYLTMIMTALGIINVIHSYNCGE